jgi:hypothetical protein
VPAQWLRKLKEKPTSTLMAVRGAIPEEWMNASRLRLAVLGGWRCVIPLIPIDTRPVEIRAPGV